MGEANACLIAGGHPHPRMETVDPVNPVEDSRRLTSRCGRQRIVPNPRGHLCRVVVGAFATGPWFPAGADR